MNKPSNIESHLMQTLTQIKHEVNLHEYEE